MEPNSTQYEGLESMSMWDVFVHAANQRYQELMEEKRQEEERQKQETPKTHSEQSEAGQPALSAQISIPDQVAVGSEDEHEEEPGRLVIDENDAEEDQAMPASTGLQENAQRETVIQQCRSNAVNSAVVPDQVVSPPVNLPVVSSTSEVKPTRQLKLNLAQLKLLRSMPYPIPMSYNKNMARKFPGAECRTPEQQAVRDKNTIAARRSRAKIRLLEEMLQQEARKEVTHNRYMKERMAATFTYVNALREKIGLKKIEDFLAEFERVKQDVVPGPIRMHYVRNRVRSEEKNGEESQSSSSGSNGQGASPGGSHVKVNERPMEIANGSETESASESDGTVLEISVGSERSRSFGNEEFQNE